MPRSKSRARCRAAAAIPLLTTAFFLRGAFLALALPYGDPLDEWFHYAYATFLAETGRVPGPSEPSISMEFVRPGAFLPRSTSFGGVRISFQEFAALSPGEREERRADSYRYRPEDRAKFLYPNYEAQQPPLAYVAASGVLALLPRAPFDTRLLALRLSSAGLASLAVPLAYAFFRRLLPKRAALAATLAFVAFPGLGCFVGRFTNDAVALPLTVSLLIAAVEISRGCLSVGRAAALGLLLAAGFWTKLYMLLFLPLLPLAALCHPGPRRRLLFRRSAAAALFALVLFLPWMLHQRRATGDWLGLTETKRAAQLGIGLTERLAAVPEVLRVKMGVALGRTFLWPGTWSAMGAPLSAAVPLLGGLALVWLAPNLLPGRASRRRRRGWGAAALAPALFLAGQIAHAATFAAVARRSDLPAAGGEGWYLLVLFPVVMAAGTAFGRRVPPRVFAGAALLFLLAEWLLALGVLPSLYGGGSDTMRTPMSALRTFSMAGLPGVSPAWLGLALALWLAALFAGAALAIFARASPRRAVSR